MQTAAAVAIGRGRGMARPTPTDMADVVETYLWVEEHDWLKALHRSPANNTPQFRVPDLLGACISIVLDSNDPSRRIFGYLGRELIRRDPGTARRHERMWREHFAQLQALQRSPANAYPNPCFSLDCLATACVAIVIADRVENGTILAQARRNMATRTERGPVAIKRDAAS